jgi:hypothetical protein
VIKTKQEPCAWHSSPEELAKAESHGVCERCSGLMIIESTRRQVNKQPSYFENRRAFDEYKEEKQQGRS